MENIQQLLVNNKAWAEETAKQSPSFFKDLEKIQTPDFLWIGCSDSRVPADKITGTQPGQIFVHRNVSNLVVNTDLNVLTVLDFAVNYLNVGHIIVCGHYNCGGIKAAYSTDDYGIMNPWLKNIKDVYRLHKAELEAIETSERVNKLVELNVIEQVKNLAKTDIVQKAWSGGKEITLHGWVYALHNGLLNELFSMSNTDFIDPIYTF